MPWIARHLQRAATLTEANVAACGRVTGPARSALQHDAREPTTWRRCSMPWPWGASICTATRMEPSSRRCSPFATRTGCARWCWTAPTRSAAASTPGTRPMPRRCATNSIWPASARRPAAGSRVPPSITSSRRCGHCAPNPSLRRPTTSLARRTTSRQTHRSSRRSCSGALRHSPRFGRWTRQHARSWPVTGCRCCASWPRPRWGSIHAMKTRRRRLSAPDWPRPSCARTPRRSTT